MDHHLHRLPWKGVICNRSFARSLTAAKWGLTLTKMVGAYPKAQLGKDPKGLKVRMGPMAPTSPRAPSKGLPRPASELSSTKANSASAPDLSSLVTKLKRAQPDVIFHTGYNPDIKLFLREARELGLKFSTRIGQVAGYGVYSKLKETVGAAPIISTTSTRSRSGRPTPNR